jgi:hypothetical protein
MTIAGMAVIFRRPAGAVLLSVPPQLASWDKAGTPGQVRLACFLAHVDALAGPLMAATSGRVAVELTVGLPEDVPLIDGGRDLDNYLFPLAQRLGPQSVAAHVRPQDPWGLMASALTTYVHRVS